MSHQKLSFLLLLCLLASVSFFTQTVGTMISLPSIPQSHSRKVDTKMETHPSRFAPKTEKEMLQLSSRYDYIQIILKLANPETAQRLLTNEDVPFNGTRQKWHGFKAFYGNYQATYNELGIRLPKHVCSLQSFEKVQSQLY